jgi:hypothetical protein
MAQASQDYTRMPNGVMDYLECGTTEARIDAAEARAATRDPESYEAALEWQATRPRAVRQAGRPIMTMIAEALSTDTEGR